MPSRLGHGLYKKIDRLKNIFRCIYIIIDLEIFIFPYFYMHDRSCAENFW